MLQTVKEDQPVSLINWCERVTGEAVVRVFFGKNFSTRQLNGRNISLELADIMINVGEYNFSAVKIFKTNVFGENYYDHDYLLSDYEKALKKRVVALRNITIDVIKERMAQYESGEVKLPEPNAEPVTGRLFLDVILEDFYRNSKQTEHDKE